MATLNFGQIVDPWQLSRLDENGPRVADERGLTVSRKLVRYRMTRIPEAEFHEMHSA